MTLHAFGYILSGGLFVGMLILLEVGRRLGARRLARDPEGARTGVSAVEGALFGLLGLLIAFTFSGAAGRLDARRKLITEEANAIGTAWLRIELLPADAQPAMRDLFRQYLDSRLLTYQKIPDIPARRGRARAFDRDPGTRSGSRPSPPSRAAPPGPSGTAFLTALNAMFDIMTTRTMAARTHPPGGHLLSCSSVLALAASLFAGRRHGGLEEPQLDPPRRIRGRAVGDGLRDPRPRVPAARVHPPRCRRPRAHRSCARA